MSNKSITVTQLNKIINEGISNILPDNIKVLAELSNVKISNGHYYLNIKDNSSLIRGIIWKSKIKSGEKFKDGDKVELEGHLDFYIKGGSLSFIVDNIEKQEGLGEVHLQYEKLKKEYKKKGYFDVENKKQPPTLIKKVTIITSKTGAALQDMLYVFKRNKVCIHIKIIDVTVQGVNCGKDVARAIEEIETDSDVVIIGRGGGSFEDLFGFSDPLIVEAIHNCPVFTISAVGHEVDFMLSDYVADYRAPTPSVAAEYIFLNQQNFFCKLDEIKTFLESTIKDRISDFKMQLLENDNKLVNPIDQIKQIQEKIKNLLSQRLTLVSSEVDSLDRQIKLLEPKKDNKITLNYKNKVINSKIELEKIFRKYNEIPVDLKFDDGVYQVMIVKKKNQDYTEN